MKNITGNNLDDKYLVDKVLAGNTGTFAVIIKNTERLVTQIVFKMINHPEDRKDVAQDIYLKTFNKLGNFKFQSKLSTWIAQISYNTCFDYLQKKKLILPGNLGEITTEEDSYDTINNRVTTYTETNEFINRKEVSAILGNEIEKLPPVFKTLITLYHHEELSYEEMVQITGLPAGTIKSYLFRARKKLKDNLLLTYKKEEL
ncbi:MAG: sigma-70 family RNA polymerase sigma factor [Chitinophagaceae bacterium]